MAIKLAKTPNEGYKYTPFSQREETEAFSVWIKPLTSKQLMVLEDKVVKRSGDAEVTLSAGEFSFNACKLCIQAWENITDADDKELKLKRNADGTVADDSVCSIPTELITEIANVCTAISRDPSQIQIFFPEDSEVVAPVAKTKKAPVVVEA